MKPNIIDFILFFVEIELISLKNIYSKKFFSLNRTSNQDEITWPMFKVNNFGCPTCQLFEHVLPVIRKKNSSTIRLFYLFVSFKNLFNKNNRVLLVHQYLANLVKTEIKLFIEKNNQIFIYGHN